MLYDDTLKKSTAQYLALQKELYDAATAPQRKNELAALAPSAEKQLYSDYADALPSTAAEKGALAGGLTGLAGTALYSRKQRAKPTQAERKRLKQEAAKLMKEAYDGTQAMEALRGAERSAAQKALDATAEKLAANRHTASKLSTPFLNPSFGKTKLLGGSVLGAVLGSLTNRELTNQITHQAEVAAARDALGAYANPLKG